MIEKRKTGFIEDLKASIKDTASDSFQMPALGEFITSGLKSLSFFPTDDDDWAFKLLSINIPTIKTVLYDNIIKRITNREITLNFENKNIDSVLNVLKNSAINLLSAFVENNYGKYSNYIEYMQIYGNKILRMWKDNAKYETGDRKAAIDTALKGIKSQIPVVIQSILSGIYGITTQKIEESGLDEEVYEKTGLHYSEIESIVKEAYVLIIISQPITEICSCLKELWKTPKEYWIFVTEELKELYYLITDPDFSVLGLSKKISSLLNVLLAKEIRDTLLKSVVS